MQWLKQRIHVSWLIALGCLTFVVGVWAALYIQSLPLVGYSAIALAVVAFWRRRFYIVPVVIIAGLLIGNAYGSAAQGDLVVYQNFIGKYIEIGGRVREDPTGNARRQVVTQLDTIIVKGHPLPGAIWTSIATKADIKRGDEVVVAGTLDEGFGNFAGMIDSSSLVSHVRPVPGDVGRVVRDWFADAVRLAIPEPQASLGIGYLTGQKSALPDDLADALRIAGLTHIVVASGYNLTILVRLSRRLFMRISKYVSAMASGLLVICFMAVTGLSPSMSRAGLVSGLSLATWYYGRQFHPFMLLPFASAVTVALQPSYAWGDLGWQLSFSAFAGVMIVAPLFQRFFFGEMPPNTLRQILGETVAAHIVTVPIVLVSFGVISNVAIPANLLIVPLVPLAMLLTFISGLAGLIVPAAAEIVGLPATWLLTYMTETAQYLAGLPWAQMQLEVQWWMVLVYYAVVTAGCIAMAKMSGFKLRESNVVV